jgi:hypothetical protein
MWVNKTEVTHEAIAAVAQFLIEHEEAMKFNYRGKRYMLSVVQLESEDVV